MCWPGHLLDVSVAMLYVITMLVLVVQVRADMFRPGHRQHIDAEGQSGL